MDTSGLTFRDLRNAILFAALIYLLLVFLSDIFEVILIFSIILLLVITLNPIVTWLEKHKIPRTLGVAMLAFLFIGLIGILFYFIFPIAAAQLSQLISQAPDVSAKIKAWSEKLSTHYPGIAKKLINIDATTIGKVSSSLIGGLTALTKSTVTLISAGLVIFISTIYTLINPKPLFEGFLRALPRDQRQRALAAADRLSIQIRGWARGAISAMLMIFLLSWIALSLIGIEQALLFAIIAGLLEIVPIIGPILSAIPPTIVALIQEPILALWVIGSFTLIQQIENHLLIPLVMSREAKLHPVTVVFWVLLMGALYGIIGIFLATPAAVTAGILYDEFYLCEYRKECPEENEKEDTS